MAALEVWFLDEARVGQTGRLCRRWYRRGGTRPRGRRDLRHEAVYLFGAVCPERDTGVALVLPSVETKAMQLMLDELAQSRSTQAPMPSSSSLPSLPGSGSCGGRASAAASAGSRRLALRQ